MLICSYEFFFSKKVILSTLDLNIPLKRRFQGIWRSEEFGIISFKTYFPIKKQDIYIKYLYLPAE